MVKQTDPDAVAANKQYKHLLYRRMGRMTVYYIVVGTLLAVALKLFPGLMAYLPLGGISEYSTLAITHTGSVEAALLEQAGANAPPPGQWLQEAIALFIAMLTTLILMVPVSWVFRTIHSGHDYDHSIDETALVLPSVVAGIVTVVQHSLALAFSLAGIVAGVRFRRALKDTFDTLFIFTAIGVGLAAGVGAVEIAVVITVFFNYATLFVCSIGEGLESKHLAIKTIAKNERKAKTRFETLRGAQPLGDETVTKRPEFPEG